MPLLFVTHHNFFLDTLHILSYAQSASLNDMLHRFFYIFNFALQLEVHFFISPLDLEYLLFFLFRFALSFPLFFYLLSLICTKTPKSYFFVCENLLGNKHDSASGNNLKDRDSETHFVPVTKGNSLCYL